MNCGGEEGDMKKKEKKGIAFFLYLFVLSDKK